MAFPAIGRTWLNVNVDFRVVQQLFNMCFQVVAKLMGLFNVSSFGNHQVQVYLALAAGFARAETVKLNYLIPVFRQAFFYDFLF